MTMLEQGWLRGSHVPLVTPFREGRVDDETLARLVGLHVREGTDGIVIGGSTGDSQALTIAERELALETAIRAARGRIAVIAATGAETLESTFRLTDHADTAGADGLLIITPRSTPAAQDGLIAYYTELARRTERPVLLYNYPTRTHVAVSLDALARIVAACPNVVGLKHTHNDLGLLRDAVRTLGPGFRVFGGYEPLALSARLAGAAGTIVAAANLVPQTCARLNALADAGETADAWRVQDTLSAIFDLIVITPSPSVAVKYLMHRAGLLPSQEHRLPATPPSPEERAQLDAAFERLGLPLAVTA